MSGSPKLGDLLIDEGVLTRRTLQTALDYQTRHSGKHKLGEILLLLELATEEQILEALSRKLRIKAVDLAEVRVIDGEVLNTVPRMLAERESVLPIAIEQRGASRRLQLAMADPTNLTAFDNIQFRLGMPIDPHLTTISQVRRAIQRFYGV
jgi:type IV pilus assembly protein PilB